MKNRVVHVPLALALTGFFSVFPAAAQDFSDPGSLERTVPTQTVETPTGQPIVDIPNSVRNDGLPVTSTFVLGAVIIEGSTVFASETLAEDFEPFLASQVGNSELMAIADRITQRYRTAGYPFSYAMVPEQEIRSGIVRIKVIEGYVGEVKFEGAGRSTRALTALAKPILKERPLRGTSLERLVGLIRDVPGVAVTDIQITRSDVDPARATMTVLATNDEVHGLVYLDNRGTVRGARTRLYSTVSLSSWLASGDRVKADFFAVPGNDSHLLYGQLDASAPVAANGVRIGTTVSLSDYRQIVSDQRYTGESRGLAAYVTYPIWRGRTKFVLGSLSFNAWQSDADLGGLPTLRDRLQVARVSVQMKSWETRTVDALFTVSKGLDLGGATGLADPLASRTGAIPGFTKLNFDVKVVQPLDERMTLRMGASGQYSSDPVLSVEEFALGGARFGRAFDYNTLTGDHGIGGAAELGYRVGDLSGGLRQLELFGSFDGGAVFRITPGSGRSQSDELVGVSAGWRLLMLGLASSIELGVPLSGPIEQQGVRGFFSLSKQFK